jgi:hypothetical protein
MEYLPVISLVVTISGLIISFLIQYFTQYMKLKEDFSRLETAIQGRLATLEVKTEVFWKSLEKSLPNILHSPHTPEMDKLLEKMRDFGLDKCESIMLKKMIEEEVGIGMPEVKQIGAALIVARLDQIIQAEV